MKNSKERKNKTNHPNRITAAFTALLMLFAVFSGDVKKKTPKTMEPRSKKKTPKTIVPLTKKRSKKKTPQG